MIILFDYSICKRTLASNSCINLKLALEILHISDILISYLQTSGPRILFLVQHDF